MPVLQANNISHRFENGDLLFQNLSCSLNTSRIGLVGRNGVGKSVLASILCGGLLPSSGSVSLPVSFSVYLQQPSQLLDGGLSVAEFLGKNSILEAIRRVESGDCSAEWFDLIGEQWDLSTRLNLELEHLGLPPDHDFLCANLSGGQLARLRLWQLFNGDDELLIPDEPSNHLDEAAKIWLTECMKGFKGRILLISHDRELLREVNEIWELSSLGLQVFGGNYDVYAEQKKHETQAVVRQLASIDKQKKKLREECQKKQCYSTCIKSVEKHSTAQYAYSATGNILEKAARATEKPNDTFDG